VIDTRDSRNGITQLEPATVPAAPGPRASMAATFIRNVTAGWASIVIGIAFAFVLAPLTVRTLGNVHYGIWSLLMQVTGYLWLFDFGVRESVVKYVAQYHAVDDNAGIQNIVRTAISMYSGVSLATLAVAAIFAAALPYVFNIPADEVVTSRITALLVGGTVAQTFVFNVFVGIVMALQKFYLISRLGIYLTVGRGLLMYALLSAGYGLIMLAMVQFSSTLLSNLLVYRLARRQLPQISVGLVWPRRTEAMKLFNYGKYVLLSNFGDKLVFASASIVIGIFQPISMLAYYAIGASLIEHLRTFIASMGAILNPISSGLEARRESDKLGRILMAGAKASVLLGLPVCIGFMVLGREFIRLWIGPEYAAAAGTVLAVLAFGNMVGLPYYMISGVLYGLGRHRVVAWSRLLEGLTNLAISVVLVQRYGVVGVAIGAVIPHLVVVGVVLPGVLPRWIRLDVRAYYISTYLRPLIAATPFLLACAFIARQVPPGNLFIFFASIALALPLYAAPVWTVALTAEERTAAREYLSRKLARRTPAREAV